MPQHLTACQRLFVRAPWALVTGRVQGDPCVGPSAEDLAVPPGLTAGSSTTPR